MLGISVPALLMLVMRGLLTIVIGGIGVGINGYALSRAEAAYAANDMEAFEKWCKINTIVIVVQYSLFALGLILIAMLYG